MGKKGKNKKDQFGQQKLVSSSSLRSNGDVNSQQQLAKGDAIYAQNHNNNSCAHSLSEEDELENAQMTSIPLHRNPTEELNASSFSLESACTQSDSSCDEDVQAYVANVQDWMDKRRLKKERQKVKRRAKKLALERKRSMHHLAVSSEPIADYPLNPMLNNMYQLVKLFSRPFSSPPGTKAELVLHKSPLATMEYCMREVPCLILDLIRKYAVSPQSSAADIKRILMATFLLGVLLAAGILWTNANDPVSIKIKQYILELSYWVFLGVLSSVGLGSGLHTFVLYLAPFIAKVTMAAEECNTVDFPEPPYPKQIICPPWTFDPYMRDLGYVPPPPSVFAVMSKVRWESLAWGLGTALGELPPYFIARAAKMTKDGSPKKKAEKEKGSKWFQMCQNFIERFIMKVGFWGILISASIPNPLFDLAGITCGHFLVPFTTFFAATVIGKTVIKSQVQMTFVVLAFNAKSFSRVLGFVQMIPRIGLYINNMLEEFVNHQRASIRDHASAKSSNPGVLKIVTDILVACLILYFVLSIVNGMAQNHHDRIVPSSSNPTLPSRKRKGKPRARKNSS